MLDLIFIGFLSAAFTVYIIKDYLLNGALTWNRNINRNNRVQPVNDEIYEHTCSVISDDVSINLD